MAEWARAIPRGPFSFMDPEFLLRALKAVVEVAGFAYLGQGLVAVFAGARRDENVIYQVFKIVTGPVTKLTRAVMPRFMPDRHIPFVAFGLLLWVWIFLLIGLANLKRGA
jgi:hypothetical protein